MATDFQSQLGHPQRIRIDAEEYLRHVTIRQIFDAERIHDTAPLMIEGHRASTIMIVANIYDYKRSADGMLDFMLDDGTGRIGCGSIRDQNSVERDFGHFAYVRVIGAVTQGSHRPKKYLRVMHLCEVTDPHEIFYHFLKVIEQSLLFEQLDGRPVTEMMHTNRAPIAPSSDEDLSRGYEGGLYHETSNMEFESETSMHHSEIDPFGYHQSSPTGRYDQLERDDWFTLTAGAVRTVSSGTTASYHTACSRRSPSPESRHHQEIAVAPHETSTRRSSLSSHLNRLSRTPRDPYRKLNNFERDIILCISNGLDDMGLYARPDHANGVNIRVIIHGLRIKYGPELKEADISSAIEYLLSEAHIFTTVDDEHYNLVQ